ncbi:MAG: hypothetical protein AAGA64_02240 [Bacteroidota bacterium]
MASVEKVIGSLADNKIISTSRLQAILNEDDTPVFAEYTALVAAYEKLPTQRQIKLTKTRRKRLADLFIQSSLEKSNICETLDLSSEIQKELSNDFEGSFPMKILKAEYDELVKYLQSGKRGRVIITTDDKQEFEGHLKRSGLKLSKALGKLNIEKPSSITIKKWLTSEDLQKTNRSDLERVKEAFERLPDRVIQFEVGYSDLLIVDPIISETVTKQKG